LDPVLEFVILAFLKTFGIIAPPVSAFSKNSESETSSSGFSNSSKKSWFYERTSSFM
jgi:hypothetical protein